MKRKLLVFFILAIPSLADAQPVFVTGNQYVWAEVVDMTGSIWFGAGPVANHVPGDTTHELSYNGRSYLSVMINDTIYINQVTGQVPALLDLIDGKTSKIADTIQTIWQRNGFDIIQDVYPVEFGISGTIVLSVEIVNHRSNPVIAQGQYLLDDDVDGIDYTYNGARSLTRYPRGYDQPAYSSVNIVYPFESWPWPVPPFFLTFAQVKGQQSFFGDLVGVGYLSDSSTPIPLGLTNPSQFVIGEWGGIGTGWGITGYYDGDDSYADEAMQIQWFPDTIGVGGKDSVGIIARTCYGTGDYDLCTGPPAYPGGYPFTALTLYPHLLSYVDGNLEPNTFTVESLIVGDTSSKGTVTLSVTGKQALIAPLPLSNGGTSQSQNVAPEPYGDVNGLMDAQWKDSVFATANATIALSLSIDDSVPGNSPHTCSLPIIMNQVEKNPSPIGKILSRTGSYDGSECNTHCTEVVAYDTGIIRIPVLSVVADSLTNIRLSIAPNHAGADSTFYTVCVIDSMLNGNAVITLKDTAGDTAIERYEYCTIADTHAPLVQRLACYDFGSCGYQVSDTQAWDRGLDTIFFYNVSDMTITPPDSFRGQRLVNFLAELPNGVVAGMFCLTAIDIAGNRFDTCFATPLWNGVSPFEAPSTSLSIFPSPIESETTILLSGAPSADVEIYDVLGREVDHFQVNGSYDWETDDLPQGTYIIRANENGPGNSQPITKRIVKE